MAYILNDDFNGGTWVDSSGTVHSGSSGIANTLPSTAIWVIPTGVAGSAFNGSAELAYYPGTVSNLFQDGASNLCITVGKKGTDGAPSTLWPTGYVDTSAGPDPQHLGGTPKYAVQLNQSCEIKVKVNPLKGLWTACWFIGVSSQYDSTWSEIDMEEAGDSGSANPLPGTSNTTIWGGGVATTGAPIAESGGFNVGDGNYHVFRLDYLENTINVYIDGVLNSSTTSAQTGANGPWNFNSNGGMYVILQIHMDATNSGTPAAASLPFEGLLVDYVRIWAPAGADPNSTGANITVAGSVALGPKAVSGTASSAAAGAVITHGSVALGPFATSSVVNGGTGGSGAGTTGSFTDAFGSDDTAANWANSQGTFLVDNAWCSVQCDTSYSSGLSTTSTYNLTGSYTYGQFLPYQTANSETGLQLYLDANNSITLGYSDGSMIATLNQAGTTTQSPLTTYNANTHAWWRIREQTGFLYFDVASDGAAWTNLWSTAYTINVTALYIGVYAGNYTTQATGTSYFTNISTNPAAVATLADGFDSDDLATTWAWSYGAVAVSGSECSIPCDVNYDAALISTYTYNLKSGFVAGEFLPYIATSAQTTLQVFLGSGAETGSTYAAEIGYTGGSMYALLYQNGTTTNSPTVTYNATNHAWWRIRESAGTLFFETSPTGTTWTSLWSKTYAFSVNGATVAVYAGDYGSDTAGTSYVTNIGVAGVTSTGSVALAPLAITGIVSSTTGSPTTSTGSVALELLAVAGTVNVIPPLSYVGTPTLTRATSGSVTPVFGTGQNDTAGDLLIAVVTAAATTSVTAPGAPSGWALIWGEGSTPSAPRAYVAAYYLVATGSDSLPAWTCTLTGTGAMTATIYEVTQYDTSGTTGWFDSYGIYASG
jgi:hypothetical protein